MTNIVVNGRGVLPTTQTQAEVEQQLSRVGDLADDAPPRGWVRLLPSRTIVNIDHIVSISDSE